MAMLNGLFSEFNGSAGNLTSKQTIGQAIVSGSHSPSAPRPVVLENTREELTHQGRMKTRATSDAVRPRMTVMAKVYQKWLSVPSTRNGMSENTLDMTVKTTGIILWL